MFSNYGVSQNHNTSFHSHNNANQTNSTSQSAANSFMQSLNGFGALGGGGNQSMQMHSFMNIIQQLLTQVNSGGEGGNTENQGHCGNNNAERREGGRNGGNERNAGNERSERNGGIERNAGNERNGGNERNERNARGGRNGGNERNARNAGNVNNTWNTNNTITNANHSNTSTTGNNAGNNSSNTQNASSPEVSINIPASTGDSNTVQFRDTNGNWQALDPNRPPNQTLQPSDIRLSNNSQGTIIGGTSGGAQLIQNGDSFTINFEDRFHSNAPNDNDFNDVSVTISNAPSGNRGIEGTNGNQGTNGNNTATNTTGNNGGYVGNGTPKPAEEAAPPPPKLDPVGIADGARVWGDPHFVGAEGGKFDVQGEDGKIYNILSDKDIQINSEFKAWGGGGATVMGEMGLTLGNDTVSFNADGELTVNGEAQGDGSYLDGAVTKEGNQVQVNFGEYELTIDSVKNSRGNYMNIAYGSENVAADGVMPHGIWGQTADGDGEARNGDKGTGAQGGGAIEGLDGEITESGDKTTVTHYEVGSLFDTNFANFNRFRG